MSFFNELKRRNVFKVGIAHILEGSVRKAGNQVRITAQLIKADDGFHLWSETYDRSLDNIFVIQDEIAAEVVAQLKLTLLGAVPTVSEINPQAFALFLHGRQLSREFTPESLEQGNALYQQALAIDPDYVEAWGELARNYINQTTNALLPQDKGLSLARAAINKALAIIPDTATSVAQNAFIAMSYDNDLTTAVRLYERAQNLEPSNLDIMRNMSGVALSLGRMDEAILLGEYITARDPVNPMGHSSLGDIYFNAGRLDDAFASYNFVLSLSPDRIGGQYSLGAVLLLKGQAEAAREAFAKEGDEEYRVKGNALASLALGHETEYKAALAELQQRWGERWPVDVAEVYARAGDADSAFSWLGKALEKTEGINTIAQDPFLAGLHEDPRWHDLLQRAGYAPEQLAAIEFRVTIPK